MSQRKRFVVPDQLENETMAEYRARIQKKAEDEGFHVTSNLLGDPEYVPSGAPADPKVNKQRTR